MNQNRMRNYTGSDVARVNKVCLFNLEKTTKTKRTTQELKLGEWNVRTLLDSTENKNRAERRTALVARELQRYEVDIAALSETRFSETGNLVEELAGYTFHWCGKQRGERRDHGVAFAIKIELYNKLPQKPTPIYERLISLRIPLHKKRYLTIISAYAPTMTCTEDDKDQFYNRLDEVLNQCKDDKLILMGDFNARVGNDNKTWPGVLGAEGIGKINANGERLLGLCTQHELLITNTIFKMPNIHKTTWMHPRSKQWHQIDFVITRQKDRRDFNTTRVMRGANCNTDHQMIRSKIKLNFDTRTNRKENRKPPKLDVAKLKLKLNRKQYEEKTDKYVREKKLTQEEDTDKILESIKAVVIDAGKEVLGKPPRRHQDWFDENNEEISKLIDAKNNAHKVLLSSRASRSKTETYRKTCRELQKGTRKLKTKWWEDKAEELQYFANTNNMKGFYDGLKEVWGPRTNQPMQLKTLDGERLLTEDSQVLDRWAEHFSNLLNAPAAVSDSALNRLRSLPSADWMNAEPDFAEFQIALNSIKDGKAPGVDMIPGELLKYGGFETRHLLWQLITKLWNTEKIPQEWRDANLVTIFKKGDRTDCSNYRGISLLSIAGKVFARILLNRLTNHVSDAILPETQCGFRAGRSTIDMIFTLRQVQEKCIEQNRPLFVVFVDFKKAFDTVNRAALWCVLKRYGCPEKFVNLIKAFHEGMYARVCSNGQFSEPIKITNGVKQGCVLAPTLFSIYLSAVIEDAFRDSNKGVHIQSRPGADLFNLSNFKSKTKTKLCNVRELMFADDTALVAHTLEDMQDIVTAFAKSAHDFGLQINMKKTEVLFQPTPGSLAISQPIHIEGNILNNVSSFTYLGSTVTSDNNLDKELQNRMAKASSAFGRLTQRLWKNHNVPVNVKCKVYKAIVISTLLYAGESWTLHKTQVKRIHAFIMRHLRKIMNIKWWQHVSNKEVLRRAGYKCVHDLLIQRNLRWAGHVARLENTRLPKQILFSQLTDGHRGRGRPKLRYKDTIKRNLKDLSIPTADWCKLAEDRDRWRVLIHSKSVIVEDDGPAK